VANTTIGFSLKVDGVDKTISSIEELDNSISQLEDTLKSAKFGSEQFKAIEQDLVKARSAKEDLDKSLEGRGAEKRLQGLVGIAESLGGAFAIASQASSLFGKENVAVAEAEAKAQQALSIVMGVRAIKEGLLNSALERKIILEKASAAGTAILNGVNKALNITLSLNPIGLIVTALGLLVVGILAAIGPIKKFISSFEFLGKAVDATLDTLRDVASFLTGGLIDDASTAKTRSNADKTIEALDDIGSSSNKMIADEKRRLALMEASGASAKQLLDQKMKINQQEIASRQAAVNALIKLQQIDGELDEDKKKKLAELQNSIKDLQNQAAIEQANYNKKLADDQKAANEKAAEKQKERADKYKEYLKELEDARKASDAKIKELANKAEIDAIKDEDEKARRTLEIQQKAAQEELQLEINKLNQKKKLSAEEAKLKESLLKQQAALTASQNIEMQNLVDTQNQALKDKEATFQKELQDLKDQAFIGSIESARERARQELQIELDKQVAEINSSELTQQQKDEKLALTRQIGQQKKTEQEAGFKLEDQQAQIAFNQWQIQDETTTFDEKLRLNAENNDIIKNMDFATEEERTMALRENAKAREQIEAASTAAKVANAEAVANLFGQMSQLLGQETAAGKAAAIAETTISTYLAAQKAYASLAGIPIVGPVLGAVAAGVAVAGGLMNVKKILAVKTPSPGGSGGGGGTGGGTPAPQPSKFAAGGYVSGPGSGTSDSIPALLSNGESVINANSTSMFSGLLSQINMAGGGNPIAAPTGGNNTPVIKTYVVASEMSSQQEADKRINDIARI
jgi:hypothetical protein